MQTLLYYPGCSVKKDFSEVERTSIAVLAALGYRTVEITSWYCCGGFPGMTTIDHVKYVSSIRTFTTAQLQARELNTNTIITLCPFCYNTLKQADQLFTSKPDVYKRVADYLKDEVEPYRSGLKVVHFVELIATRLSDIAKLAESKLKGVRVAAYYGCMLLRPKVIAIDNPENPRVIESIIETLGALPVKYPYRTYCCGSFHILAEPDIVKRNVEKIAWSITNSGADIVVTPCPLCLYNLKKYTELKALHLSELVAYTMNLHETLSSEVLKTLNSLRVKT